MSVLSKLACAQNRRDEAPNQELAKELATKVDRKGIREIAENLWNNDKNIQNDCIKVLYEIGYLKPDLIGDYVSDFVKLLSSRNNRLVWGGMIALSTVAAIRAKEVYAHLDKIRRAMANGSVITIDNGVKVLARVAAAKPEYNRAIFPYLLDLLEHCRPQSIAQYAESTLCAVNVQNRKKYIAVLTKRQSALSPAQSARIRKILKTLSTADKVERFL
ncbi:MAG: hypothetical protein AB1817_09745 [Chloroflexota bacterium]